MFEVLVNDAKGTKTDFFFISIKGIKVGGLLIIYKFLGA